MNFDKKYSLKDTNFTLIGLIIIFLFVTLLFVRPKYLMGNCKRIDKGLHVVFFFQ